MAEKVTDEASIDYGKGMNVTIFGIKKKFPSVKNINTATLSTWMKVGDFKKEKTVPEQESQQQGLLILVLLDHLSRRLKDARPDVEYEISHIPGAVRVDYTQQPEDILSQLPNVKETVPSKIVCYCSVGYRSSTVAEKLSDYYQKQADSKTVDIYNLEGSLFQWANEGRTMVDKLNQPTKYAHPYNTMFGMLLNSDLRKNKL